MPIEALPGKLVVPSRSQLLTKFLGWVLVRNAAADTRPGGQPYLDASVWADAASSVLALAVAIANSVSRATATGSRLDDWATRLGTQRQGAVGAAGAVLATIASSGATVVAGDMLTHPPTQLRFQVTNTGVYQSSTPIPISGIDTGSATNLPAGTVLQWASTRPGVLAGQATVVSQADGSGLSGGVPEETDDQLRARLDYLALTPPASGNDAQYQATALTTPGVALGQCFTYPAVLNPGTVGVTFTLRPAQPGANRIPNATQLALVAAFLGGVMPASDSVLMCALVASPVTVVLKTLWAIGASGWTDGTTFPLYHSSPNLVSASANASGVLSPTAFRLSSSAMTEVPQVGQSVGFLDLTNLVFRRKKIGAVTAVSGTQYDITVDTSTGVSDTGYTPVSGQACCPWSDSLTSLVTPVVAYFDTLGPGEQYSSFFDPGVRQRRTPVSPQFWPNMVTNRLLGGAAVPVAASGPHQNQPPVPTLLTTPAIQDVVLVEPSVPFTTPVGTPGVSSNLLTLGNLVVFPE